MPLPLKADQVVSAIREWVTAEIKQAPSFSHDLGKHYFTTTTATAGLFATLAKLDAELTAIPMELGVAFVVLFVAAVVALLLSIPFPRVLDGSTDLFAEYSRAVMRIVRYSIAWVILWGAGSFLALWGLLS